MAPFQVVQPGSMREVWDQRGLSSTTDKRGSGRRAGQWRQAQLLAKDVVGGINTEDACGSPGRGGLRLGAWEKGTNSPGTMKMEPET